MGRRHVPSAAQVRGWKITTAEVSPKQPTVADNIHYEVDSNPVPNDGTTLRHGYTLDDLDRLARRVVTAHLGWWSGGDRHDQYNVAWSGIAERLCTAVTPPTPADLTAAGTVALDHDIKANQRHHGITRAGTTGPRYAAYWHEPAAEPWEDRLIDSIAVQQVLSAAAPADREAIMTLAALGSAASAALALGISNNALKQRLSRGRAACRLHWYAPDTAPPMRRPPSPGRAPSATHCSAGHELTPENIAWMAPKKPGRPRYGRCRECQRRPRSTEMFTDDIGPGKTP